MDPFKQIFGKRVEEYRIKIKEAFETTGQYEKLKIVLPDIVLYITSATKLDIKAVYPTLDAFIGKHDEIVLKEETEPFDPLVILKAAKEYIDLPD